MSTLDRLRELGFEVPDAPPRHEFVPLTLVGDLVFVSGHAPYCDGAFRFRGRVGSDLDIAAGRRAAELALLGCLRALQDSFGTLDAVRRVVKVTAYVNCASDFHDLPLVADAASSILVTIFGENGRHARTTIGVSNLPEGVAVEVDLIVQMSSAGTGHSPKPEPN